MKETQKIILTRGIQGSGKSTWAKQWVAEKPDFRIRINYDDLRCMMAPYKVDSWNKREKVVKSLLEPFIITSLKNGFSIVVDNMNLSESSYSTIKGIINKNGYSEIPIEYKDFFTDLKTCIQRDAKRETPIGAAIIKSTYNQYRLDIKYRENLQISSSINEYNEEKPNALIMDFDNTLCYNLSKREYFGKDCHIGMENDVPNQHIIKMVKDFISANEDGKVFIITGRDKTNDVINASIKWLEKYFNTEELNKIEVFYKPTKPQISSTLYKISVVENEILPNYNIQCAIDDNKKVIEVYRLFGIVALECNN